MYVVHVHLSNVQSDANPKVYSVDTENCPENFSIQGIVLLPTVPCALPEKMEKPRKKIKTE